MPSISDFYPSNYLRAADLGGKEVDVIIDRVTSDEFEQDGKKRTKPVVHFRNTGIKPLVTNKTNALLIAAACSSDDYNTWPGKQVRLYADLVNFRGKVSEAIRVNHHCAAAEAMPGTGTNVAEHEGTHHG
jgi:hypothetical protein